MAQGVGHQTIREDPSSDHRRYGGDDRGFPEQGSGGRPRVGNYPIMVHGSPRGVHLVVVLLGRFAMDVYESTIGSGGGISMRHFRVGGHAVRLPSSDPGSPMGVKIAGT